MDKEEEEGEDEDDNPLFQDLFWKTYFGGRGASSGLKISYGEYTVPVCVAQFKDTKLRMPAHHGHGALHDQP